MEDLNIKVARQRNKKSKNRSRNRFSDDTNSSNSSNLHLSQDSARGDAHLDHPAADRADYSNQWMHQQDRLKRKGNKSWKKKADRRWERRVSPTYENGRLQEILKGQVEPYEIFTGMLHVFFTFSHKLVVV